MLLLMMFIAFFTVFIILALFAFWIWAIIHCITSDLNPAEKALWIIVIVLLSFIGALLYLIFSKAGGKRMPKTKLRGKKLIRSAKNRMIAGVCGGIGEYLGVDPTAIRLLWVLISFFTGILAGVIAYLVAWAIIPENE
jgi:phage shock protein PspC (stress-responsive transcriptional regulator)